jgi:hypothetical protein
MSLTRGPARLIRRLSGSRTRGGAEDVRPGSSSQDDGPLRGMGMQRSSSVGGASGAGSYFPSDEAGPQRPVNQFHRRPTNLSVKEARKAAAKGGADGTDEDREPGHISLENGLDISLNMEVDQKDPRGETVPYRLLVPALWYEGAADVNTARFKSRGAGFMERLRGRKRIGREVGEDGYSRSPTPSPPPSRGQQMSGAAQQYAAVDAAAPGQPGRRVSADQPRAAPAGPPSGAFNKGYNLASPPIGPTRPAPPTVPGGANNNPYPQSGIRHASAPVSNSRGGAPRQAHNEPWRHDDDMEYDSQGSLTPSDELDDGKYMGRSSMQQGRRPSKAERFFGIGDEGGVWGRGGARRPSMQQDARGAADGEYLDDGEIPAEGKKRGWKIWR